VLAAQSPSKPMSRKVSCTRKSAPTGRCSGASICTGDSNAGSIFMQWSHCPYCYNPLETCAVTPCFICGGWPERIEQFTTEKKFIEYRLPNDHTIILCSGCEVEEFMVEGGWGFQMNFPTGRLPINHLRFTCDVNQPQIGQDKYCNNCYLRLAFMKILAERNNQED
jgi:hypothetical protein